MAHPEKLSVKGINAIIREEGSIPYAYEDPDHGPHGNLKGWATFGVGHLIEPKHRGVTAADRKKWGSKQNPKPALVRPTLKDDLKDFERAVRVAVKPALRQHEFDALVSLAFNIGIGGFTSSTVVRELNKGRGEGNFRRAADAILRWDNPAMLRPRREREKHLFLTGQYRRP